MDEFFLEKVINIGKTSTANYQLWKCFHKKWGPIKDRNNLSLCSVSSAQTDKIYWSVPLISKINTTSTMQIHKRYAYKWYNNYPEDKLYQSLERYRNISFKQTDNKSQHKNPSFHFSLTVIEHSVRFESCFGKSFVLKCQKKIQTSSIFANTIFHIRA